MNYVAENIKHYRKLKKLTQADLAAKLGLNRSLIGAYEEGRSEPRLKTLQALADFFKVSLDNFISKPQAEFIPKLDLAGNKLRVLSVLTNEEGDEQIALIPQKASAGYTRGYGDIEYMENLKSLRLPFKEIQQERTHRVFQIEGDSMLPLEDQAYLITEYIEDWNDIKDNETYVIISKNEGIVYKRLLNQIKSKQSLVLQSDNKEYKPYSMPINEVLEVWKAKASINFNLNQQNSDKLEQDELLKMMLDLKKDMLEIKNKIS